MAGKVLKKYPFLTGLFLIFTVCILLAEILKYEYLGYEAINVIGGGIITAYIFARILSMSTTYKNKKLYGKIDGLFNAPKANASIRHIALNTLEIVVFEHGGDEWVGFIKMTSERFGELDWQYFVPIEKSNQFGKKKIQVISSNKFILYGEIEKGFGSEEFLRSNIQRARWQDSPDKLAFFENKLKNIIVPDEFMIKR